MLVNRIASQFIPPSRDDDINVLVLIKSVDRYIILYDRDNIVTVKQLMGRWASDPELDFSWYDASVLCKRVRAN